MKQWLAFAAIAVAFVGAAGGCSRDRDSGSGIRDSKDAGVNAPASIPTEHQHGVAPQPGSNEPRTSSPGTRPEIVLNPDMIARAGIKTVAAVKGTSSTRLHLPGAVQPNAYKNIDVTSLVSGRVTQVRAELGQRVMLNEVLAIVYSPELADAQTTFIAARAEHLAHDQAQARTQRLYAIGAASRQELERLEAEKSEMDAKVETARARLVLLGIPEEKTQRLASPADVVTTFDVKAPIAGIITRRNANPGLNIDLATALFTVTDLSTVWVIADLYERDFSSVGVGSPVSITTPAYPGMDLRGRVDYIDPQVQPETRTAKLRAEVPNGGSRLRLGMFVDVSIGARTSRPVVMVPKGAVQTIGAQSVVYVSTGPGRFVQREVTVGDTMGNDIAVSSGLEAGDAVVTEGAFFLRAEHERLP